MEPLFEGHLKLMCLSSIAPQVGEKFYVSMGVRYISADEHTTNIEQASCISRVSGVGPSLPAHVRRPSDVYTVHLCIEFQLCAQLDAPSECSRIKNVGAVRSIND